MKTKKGLALLCLLLALPAAAIELSLEENKAERGSIGYIDIQRLFKQFPETIRAKENFEELVRQAEEQVNLRKTEVLRLRNELSQLRIQREFLAKTPIEVSKAPKPASPSPAQAPAPIPAPAPATAPKPAAPAAAAGRRDQEPETDLTRPSLANMPGFTSAASTPTALAQPVRQPEPTAINIPGVSTAPIVVQPPAVAVSTTASAPEPQLASNSALSEFDAKIAAKEKELAAKELDSREQQASSEKNLLDLESRKTEMLLGKIHRAVQDVARHEGISVVVDKSSILFGHDAVDLTDKVMKYLKGT